MVQIPARKAGMNRIHIAIALASSLWVLPLNVNAQSGSIYSWTDENGVKHFSDRAPDEVAGDAEEIPLDYGVTSSDANAATLNNETLDSTASGQAAATPAGELSYADQQRLAMQEKRKAQQEKAAERNRVCLQARDQLARVEPSRRVFYTDENGETTRLDDDAREQLVEESKSLIAEYCD
jgi:hypothetical protein